MHLHSILVEETTEMVIMHQSQKFAEKLPEFAGTNQSSASAQLSASSKI
jgi:hypothetical protein